MPIAEKTKASAKVIDMTNVKDGGATFNKKRVPAGDYIARIVKVQDAEVKRGDNKGAFQWLFTIQLEKIPSAKYPYYCQLAENQLWKVRNLLLAAGINVPKKKLKLDPEKVVGKLIAVTMDDSEYEGKVQSEVAAVFPPAELEGGDEDDEEDEDEEEDEDDDEEEEPAPAPKKKAKRAPEPEPEEDEDEDEDEDEEEEEDDEDEEEEPPPPPKKKAAKAAAKPAAKAKRKVTDEELDELDIDDL